MTSPNEATTFTVAEQQIPTFSQEPVKMPLLVYDICSSTVEAIEAKINKYTRKWPGVPLGLSDVAMYCRKAKLKLPMKSILEEYKCGKARLLTMSEESGDRVVKTIQPSLKTGRKWKVTEAVDEAKECLKLKR
ncbi:reverse transcriptase [Plakobranchus ocellatus]|uniref:Reverse transcriptase n=1 Tax=Plakobranchus ocellatus TaxID=259542 RepID=A0AAV4ALR5_9GAST|nr:reverse transcriptase [Plakobranchus ocellatus]